MKKLLFLLLLSSCVSTKSNTIKSSRPHVVNNDESNIGVLINPANLSNNSPFEYNK